MLLRVSSQTIGKLSVHKFFATYTNILSKFLFSFCGFQCASRISKEERQNKQILHRFQESGHRQLKINKTKKEKKQLLFVWSLDYSLSDLSGHTRILKAKSADDVFARAALSILRSQYRLEPMTYQTMYNCSLLYVSCTE